MPGEGQVVPPKSKNVKGLNVSDQIRTLCLDDPNRRGWPASEFAMAIGCSESSVVESSYWKVELAEFKASEQAARLKAGKRVDGRRIPKSKKR